MDLTKLKKGFVNTNNVGFIQSSPEFFGTGMRVNITVKIPLLLQHPKFEDILLKQKLSGVKHDDEHSNTLYVNHKKINNDNIESISSVASEVSSPNTLRKSATSPLVGSKSGAFVDYDIKENNNKINVKVNAKQATKLHPNQALVSKTPKANDYNDVGTLNVNVKPEFKTSKSFNMHELSNDRKKKKKQPKKRNSVTVKLESQLSQKARDHINKKKKNQNSRSMSHAVNNNSQRNSNKGTSLSFEDMKKLNANKADNKSKIPALGSITESKSDIGDENPNNNQSNKPNKNNNIMDDDDVKINDDIKKDDDVEYDEIDDPTTFKEEITLCQTNSLHLTEVDQIENMVCTHILFLIIYVVFECILCYLD